MGNAINESDRYYYLIKSHWVPENPEDTFLPFVRHLISCYRESAFYIDDFEKEFEAVFYFNVTKPILDKCLSKMVSQGFLSSSKNGRFSIEKKPEDGDFSGEANAFSITYNRLLDGFIAFTKSPVLTRMDAEQIVDNFCALQEVNSKTYLSGFDESMVPSGNNFYFANYVKYIHEHDGPLFDFLVSLCEAHLIKNFVCKPNDSSLLRGKTIYLDAPIVIKLLGYNGQYFQKEYASIIDELLKYGNSFKIFHNTLEEIKGILREAELTLEAAETDPFSHVSPASFYFSEQNMGPNDVELELANVEKNLVKRKVSIDCNDADYESKKKYVQNELEIKNAIIDQYRANGNDFIVLKDAQIECDAMSVSKIYLHRANNHAVSIKDVSSFFMTNNVGLFKAIKTYNAKKYPRSFSPVVHDSYIGLVVSLENLITSKQIMEGQVLAFCYSAYHPTQKMLDTFRGLLDKGKKENSISMDDYLLLRSGSYLYRALSDCTTNDLDEITPEKIEAVINKAKSYLVEKNQAEFDLKIQQNEKGHQEREKQIEEENREKIVELKNTYLGQIELVKRQEKEEKIVFAQSDYKKAIRKISILRWFLFSIVFIASVVLTIFSFVSLGVPGIWKVVFIVATVISTLFGIFGLFQEFSKSSFFTAWKNKAKEKIAKKYKLESSDF